VQVVILIVQSILLGHLADRFAIPERSIAMNATNSSNTSEQFINSGIFYFATGMDATHQMESVVYCLSENIVFVTPHV